MLPDLLYRRPTGSSPDPVQELERLLGPTFGGGGREPLAAYPVDIHEDNGHVYVEAELPGFNKDDVDVRLERGALSISAERKDEEKSGSQHLTERRFRRYQRSFVLPSRVDESNVDARLENGILHITLNKEQQARGHRIEVK